MPNIITVARRALFRDYMRELSPMLREPYDETETDECFDRLTNPQNKDIRWIDLFRDGKLAGFLAVAKDAECHPCADWFIIQTYVAPAFRRMHIAYKAAVQFLKEHKGVFVLDIAKGNNIAHKFWAKVFLDSGYERIVLPYVPHGEGNAYCYAWRPSQGKKALI